LEKEVTEGDISVQILGGTQTPLEREEIRLLSKRPLTPADPV